MLLIPVNVLAKILLMILLFIMHPLLEKRNILLLFVLLLFPTSFMAADAETAILFIQSDPINANILIDGTPILQKTPALLMDIQSGKHSIGIRKEGFAPADFDIIIEAGETRVFKAELLNGTIIMSFPDNKNSILRTGSDIKMGSSLRLSEGSYQFDKADNNLYITPLYPKQNLLTITGTLFFTALAANTVSVAIELDKNGELFLPHSMLLVITEAVTSVIGLTELALLMDKQRFIKNFELYEADLGILDSEADHLFNRAQTALSTGRIEDALSGFSEVIGNYPDYSGFPEALYKTSKLHIISGDTNMAISELNIIIDRFPDAGIYDKACQTLSILYYNSDQQEKSRAAVERMAYYDPIFSETEEEISRIGIDRVIENWVGNPERQAE